MSANTRRSEATCDNCGGDCGRRPYELTVDLDGHTAVVSELCFDCADSLATGETEVEFADA